MSPTIFCCTICGCLVLPDWDRESSETWAPQFRALCTGPEGLLLTGVGRYDDPREGIFRAPLDKDKCWSDDGYDASDSIELGVLVQPDFGGRHGFIFHSACWSLLEEALQPAQVPLQRLLEVCKSLPLTRDCRTLSWGHDFGGAGVVDRANYFPWGDRYDTLEFDGPHPTFRKNPYDIPGVDRILAEPPEHPPTPSATIVPPREPVKDCFALLPQELRTAIAMYLPTAVVLRARLASRAFWPVFHDQHFWASRFKTSTERSWLVEARGCLPKDWRWLYRRTADSRISPGLQNRRRIWGLLQGVLDTLALSWNELPPVLQATWLPDSALRETTHRTEAMGNFWIDGLPRYIGPFEGCARFKSQCVAVPDSLRRLSVYTLNFGDGRYIVGMSLATSTGDAVRLGYSSPLEQSVEVCEVWGFRLAIGARGVKALQCITGPASSQSPWLGSPDDTSQTERLMVRNRIIALETAFDGCKMVSIAVHTLSPPSSEISAGGNRLRDSGLWYPTVPPRKLFLNEDSFPPLDAHLVGFRPLFWCRFGGPGGAYLRYLTGITVTACVGILRVRFAFNADEAVVPLEHRSFGRLKEIEEYETVVEFTIDGPGGERIDCVETRHYYAQPNEALPWLVKEGTMVRCELHTSFGRSCRIFDSRRLGRKKMEASVRTKVQAAAGTAITGFYATQRLDNAYGITAMGIMTEEVSENGVSI